MSSISPYALNLLNLPGEIRNNIYEMVLSDRDGKECCPFVLESTPGKRKYGYSLTQTCHQIRDETLHMWHATNKLLFAMRSDNMKHYLNWLYRRPEGSFSSVRRIRLEDYQHRHVTSPHHHPNFCKNGIIVNLNKKMPVSSRREKVCFSCPAHDSAVDRVHAVVRTLEWQDGRWALTRDKLMEIFEAAAWNVPAMEE